ncbi:MAG: hypothetical protein MUF44_00690 [Hydrogenophaga sp.]|jgi:hypothetical protein|nr:hypothetical protein [Hydrogenophaga sp.]
MTINTTPKEMPTGDGHPTAGNTINDLDSPTIERREKVFETLRACYAMKGHALHRTDPADGPVTFWVERWGLVRHLPTIDAARRFLDQIGGRL